MDAARTSVWQERTAQQLVRYEALFRLLDDIQQTESLEAICRRVAQQWKYFANVACWRLLLPKEEGFSLLEGYRGEAHVGCVATLDDWDAHHWAAQKPCLIQPAEIVGPPFPPEHFRGEAVSQIQVLPIVRLGQPAGLLSVAARHQPFTELDAKFIRIFGSHLTDRLSSIELRRQTLSALVDKATRDALTGLLNRGAVMEQLERSLTASRDSGHPLSLVLADIDFFKDINDSHGHQTGDQVLREVARRLRAHTLSGDYLGRYGGEEFLFVLHPCGPEEVAMAAERFRRVVAEPPIQIGPGAQDQVLVTLSLGTASTDGHSPTRLEELIQRADKALYCSKQSGRNRVTAG